MTPMFKVVMVDDEPWALSGLQNIIPWEEYGFSVIDTCTNPLTALELLREEKHDAIFADIKMPYLSGIELLQMTREESLSCEFVIVSAYSDFEVAQQAIRLGAFDYLLKPLKKEDVRKVSLRLRNYLTEKAQKNTSAKTPSGRKLKIAPGELCFLLVSGNSDEKPDLPGLKILETVESNNETVFYITTRLNEDRLFEILKELRGKGGYPIGVSTAHRSFEEYSTLLSEAHHSLTYNFYYSSNSIASGIQKYICEHYNEDVSIGTIAEHFNFTETYLCDLFKKHTGQTMLMFATNIRIKEAMHLLVETDLSVREIASKVGYVDFSYFSRVFKNHCGVTPSSYRASSGMTSSMTE